MSSSRADLERLPRDELVSRARSLGVARPEVMTRVELVDEIVRLSEHDPVARRRARGWLGIARDLVASLIEQGLNMPDAADLVRSGAAQTRSALRTPVATVTLAEIYAAQGHVRRALSMLGEVLSREPDHGAARTLRDRLASDRELEPEPAGSPEIEDAPDSEEIEAAPETPRPDSEPAREVRPEPIAASSAPLIPEPITEVRSEPIARSSAPEPALTPEPAAVAAVDEGWSDIERPAPSKEASVLVIVKNASDAWSIYWEIPSPLDPRTVVQIAAWVPCVGGAVRIDRRIAIRERSGSAVVTRLGGRAVVRAAIGVGSGADFRAREVASVIDRSSSEPSIEWSPFGKPSSKLEPVHRRALSALDARPS